MRGRRFASNQDIERHIANGFGAGAGAEYVPWLRVQDVPSMGRSWKSKVLRLIEFITSYPTLNGRTFYSVSFQRTL